MASLTQKIARNLNIEMKKAKIILFSDIMGGFDLVLKIKDLLIINNKQSPWMEKLEHLEIDQEADTIISIGHISLHYYDSSLKKTNKFTILAEHKNVRMFNFQAMLSRRVIKFSDTLEVRIDSNVYKKIALLWNLMTMQRVE